LWADHQPDGLRRCIEGNVVQGTSRALSEEVAFDRTKVTSTDWLSCPILDITEPPETVDIVLLNRPEMARPASAACGEIKALVWRSRGRFCHRLIAFPAQLFDAHAGGSFFLWLSAGSIAIGSANPNGRQRPRTLE
jgi:hypothetical protein